MERSAWTSERLDDRFDQIDHRFDRVDTEISDLRMDSRTGFSGLRGEINELRLVMIRGYVAMIIALVGVIAAILASGA